VPGRLAVVSGGALGIGAATVRALAAHGAEVLLVDRDGDAAAVTAEEVTSAGGRVRVLVGDVTDPSVPAEVSRVFAPDIVVNNVGHYLGAQREFTESDPARWEELRLVNLDHVLRMTHALVPGMIERGRGGSIVNLTTVEAHRAIPGQVVYSAYKAAVAQFTRSLGVELGRYQIRVNAVAPDLIETPQLPFTERVAAADWHRWAIWAPLGRHGTADDVAGAVLFLASPLSSYVTGTTVHVDGGTLAAGGWFRRLEGGWTNRPRDP
jgi:NAD(P)-dependent dehydrogenase (short-subunit alcohol dehydrogenase family)